jgi:Tn3 transposase DDE domain
VMSVVGFHAEYCTIQRRVKLRLLRSNKPGARRAFPMIVLWNTLYMDTVLDQLRAEGYSVLPEDEARLSPFVHELINMLGRLLVCHAEAVARGELRPCETHLNGDQALSQDP